MRRTRAGWAGRIRGGPRWPWRSWEHKDESTPGKAKVIQSIGPRLAARYPGEEIRLPPRSTAYRRLAELERRQPTFGVSGKRRRDIAGRPTGSYGKLRPSRPGEYLLMDTTRLDVFALDQLTFRWVQPELSVAMDWYSRCITGIRVTPVSTKSVDIAATLFPLAGLPSLRQVLGQAKSLVNTQAVPGRAPEHGRPHLHPRIALHEGGDGEGRRRPADRLRRHLHRPGTYKLTANVTWTACWAKGLATPGGPPAGCKPVPGAAGLAPTTTAPVQINVRDIQSVNNG